LLNGSLGAAIGLTGLSRVGRIEMYAEAACARRKAVMKEQSYWQLLFMASRPGPTNEEDLISVLQPVLISVRTHLGVHVVLHGVIFLFPLPLFLSLHTQTYT